MSKSMTEPSPRDKSARSTARSGSNKRSASADTKKAAAAAAQDSVGAHGNNSSDGTAGAAAAVHANGGGKPVARSGIISEEVIVLGVRLSFWKKD